VSLALAQAPDNDDFDAAIVIPSLPFTDTQVTTDATEAPDDRIPEPSCPFGTSHSVWYQFTPSGDMSIAADTSGSDYDTTLSVYTGDRSSLSEVACDDDAIFPQSRVVFDAAAGVTYFFMVGSYSYFDPPGGTLVFNVDVAPPPFEFDLRVDELEMGSTMQLFDFTASDGYRCYSCKLLFAHDLTSEPLCVSLSRLRLQRKDLIEHLIPTQRHLWNALLVQVDSRFPMGGA
jgi:hypothetical protein